MLIIENSTPALIRREKLNNIAKTLIKCSEVRKSIFFKKLKFVPEIEFTVDSNIWILSSILPYMHFHCF